MGNILHFVGHPVNKVQFIAPRPEPAEAPHALVESAHLQAK
jgi:hypothetical protein